MDIVEAGDLYKNKNNLVLKDRITEFMKSA